MSTGRKILVGAIIAIVILAGVFFYLRMPDKAQVAFANVTGADPELTDPRAESFPTAEVAKPVGWAEGEKPVAAPGLTVERFSVGLSHPRTLYTLPNGDVLVALTNRPPESDIGGIEGFIAGFLFAKAGADVASANEIAVLRDSNGDGRADQTFPMKNAALASPSGMAWHDGTLYVANHNALLAFSFTPGDTKLTGKPKKLMDLPGGGNHWMRNVVIDPAGENLYVAVGSASNIAERGIEAEQGRAAIWQYSLKTGKARLFASGMRNPNGLAFSPWTGELWTTVNERDMLGSDLVPDYLTNVPIGAQYGWPWVYWRDNFDQRVDAPQPAYFNPQYVRIPEYALGPHVAALGLSFAGNGSRLGEKFVSGAVIAEHGSWNREPKSGYDVVFVRFDARGNPTGKPVPILTGFLSKDGKTTHGRPTWVAWAKDGALLVSDDTAGIVWRVTAPGAKPAPEIKPLTGPSLPPQRELRGQEASFGESYAQEVPK
ncbi:sorbosone dehydrogenase family protein [Tsuneonella flava]|uniref:Sorbosone dehydrogenase family protein n=1 Tax=Tsuneonella flava TaxID=2055955 RepID=A0ABX7K9Y5_9SPHN|nr:sorbosone dehydrogenase family protein [Tsuneonella flava]QSB45068.1 sorbosone dehydrogenase family protein [Tsuneonella flava]